MSGISTASLAVDACVVSEPDPGLSDRSWFAVWTRSRHERLVCDELGRKSIQTFLPTISRMSRWKDRRKLVVWPLFPGYCFARFGRRDHLRVLNCNGVVTVLSSGNGPEAVPNSEIEALQQLVESGLTYGACASLEVGALVRVVSGPLAGVVGRLERKGAQDQLVLAVNLLKSGARVQVSAYDIEPV